MNCGAVYNSIRNWKPIRALPVEQYHFWMRTNYDAKRELEMEINHKMENGILIIAIKGRLDAATSPAADETIKETMGQGSDRLLFDLSDLEYLSSGGLRVILSAAKEIRRRKGKVTLCCLNQYVDEIFEVSGFKSMIPIKDTVEAGIEELKTG
jgi:anti-sigma B factor antagonist